MADNDSTGESFITIEEIAAAAEAAFGEPEVEGFAVRNKAAYAQMGMSFLGNLSALGKPINLGLIGQGRPTSNFRAI